MSVGRVGWEACWMGCWTWVLKEGSGVGREMTWCIKPLPYKPNNLRSHIRKRYAADIYNPCVLVGKAEKQKQIPPSSQAS